MKSLLFNSLVMLIGANLGNALNFLSHILIARLLLPQDFGLFQSLINLTAIAGVIFTSLSLVIVNQASQVKSKTFYLKPFLNLSLKLSVLLSFLFLILYPFISQKFSLSNPNTYLIFILILLTSFIPIILSSLLQAKLKFHLVSLLSILNGSIKLIFIWLFLTLKLQISGALLAILFTTIISSLIIYLFTKPFIKQRHRQAYKLPWKYIATTTITNLGLISLISTDVILARIFLSPNQSGYYAAASSLAKIIFFALSPIFTVTFPIFSSKILHFGTVRLFKQASILLTSLAIIIFIILKFNPANLIVFIYGTNYQSATNILPLAAIAVFLYTLFYLSIQFLLAQHHPVTIKIISFTAILQITFIVLHHPTPTSIITNTIISITLGLLLTKVSPLLKN